MWLRPRIDEKKIQRFKPKTRIKLKLQVVPGQAGGGSFENETPIRLLTYSL